MQLPTGKGSTVYIQQCQNKFSEIQEESSPEIMETEVIYFSGSLKMQVKTFTLEYVRFKLCFMVLCYSLLVFLKENSLDNSVIVCFSGNACIPFRILFYLK